MDGETRAWHSGVLVGRRRARAAAYVRGHRRRWRGCSGRGADCLRRMCLTSFCVLVALLLLAFQCPTATSQEGVRMRRTQPQEGDPWGLQHFEVWWQRGIFTRFRLFMYFYNQTGRPDLIGEAACEQASPQTCHFYTTHIYNVGSHTARAVVQHPTVVEEGWKTFGSAETSFFVETNITSCSILGPPNHAVRVRQHFTLNMTVFPDPALSRPTQYRWRGLSKTHDLVTQAPHVSTAVNTTGQVYVVATVRNNVSLAGCAYTLTVQEPLFIVGVKAAVLSSGHSDEHVTGSGTTGVTPGLDRSKRRGSPRRVSTNREYHEGDGRREERRPGQAEREPLQHTRLRSAGQQQQRRRRRRRRLLPQDDAQQSEVSEQLGEAGHRGIADGRSVARARQPFHRNGSRSSRRSRSSSATYEQLDGAWSLGVGGFVNDSISVYVGQEVQINCTYNGTDPLFTFHFGDTNVTILSEDRCSTRHVFNRTGKYYVAITGSNDVSESNRARVHVDVTRRPEEVVVPAVAAPLIITIVVILVMFSIHRYHRWIVSTRGLEVARHDFVDTRDSERRKALPQPSPLRKKYGTVEMFEL